jgi:hypothetical protein
MLVDLVLYAVSRNDFDVSTDGLGKVLARVDAMPRVRTILEWPIMHGAEPIAHCLLRPFDRERPAMCLAAGWLEE